MKSKKRTAVIGVLLFLIIACIVMFAVVATTVKKGKIVKNVYIEEVNVGNMTKKEAKEAIKDYVDRLEKTKITLKAESEKETLTVKQMGINLHVDETVDKAYNVGRSKNLIANFINVCKAKHGKDTVDFYAGISKKQAKKVLKDNEKSLILKTQNASLKRENGEFTIIKEVYGQEIVYDKSIQTMQDEISNEWNNKPLTIKVTVKKEEPEYKEADMKSVTDVLGKYSTSYGASSYGRCQNVENGCSKINGTVLYPGETLSVYKLVAPFDKEHGYYLAPSYASGQVVESYGGGICQVSTTLYDAVLRAELEVVERSNHSMTVHYVPLSADAAIAGTEKDFKFKNNQKTPIYIEGQTSGGMISFTIYGKETRDKDRTISFESKTISVKAPGEIRVNDPNLEEGREVVTSGGTTGYVAELWKVIYKNGKEVKRVKINTSYYNSSPKKISVGTKPVQPATTESPQSDGDSGSGGGNGDSGYSGGGSSSAQTTESTQTENIGSTESDDSGSDSGVESGE